MHNGVGAEKLRAEWLGQKPSSAKLSQRHLSVLDLIWHGLTTQSKEQQFGGPALS
jgi:hypothetical protein